MKRAFPAFFALLVLAGIALLAFPPRGRMQKAVQDFGFGEVRLTGFALLGCSEHDTFRQKWAGRTASGKPVHGVVCGGLARGWTIRLT